MKNFSPFRTIILSVLLPVLSQALFANTPTLGGVRTLKADSLTPLSTSTTFSAGSEVKITGTLVFTQDLLRSSINNSLSRSNFDEDSEKTVLRIEEGAALFIGDAQANERGELRITENTVLIIEAGAYFEIEEGSKLVVEEGGHVVVVQGAEFVHSGSDAIVFNSWGQLCVICDCDLSTLDLGAISLYLDMFGLGLQDIAFFPSGWFIPPSPDCIITITDPPLIMPTIYFSYDASGNRKSRTITLPAPAPPPSGTDFLVEHGLAHGLLEKQELSEEVYTDKLNESDVIIFPNPTRGALAVEIRNKNPQISHHLTVFNLNGAIVFQRSNIGNYTEIDLSSRPKGVYLMRIGARDSSVIWKIIKE